VASEGYQQPEIRSIVSIILLAALVIILPGLQWSLFGWLHIFLPLLVFLLFSRFGAYTGKKILLVAAIIAFAVYLLTGNIILFLFAGSMLIPGIVLHRSTERGESPFLSGTKGWLSLATGWLVVLIVTSISSEVSAYSQMLYALEQALNEALEQYRQSAGISAEALVVIEAAILQMKVVIPVIMPGIVGSLILLITLMTMILGNLILEKGHGFAVWPRFQLWVLPEKLVWIVIVMGAFILIPVEPLPRIGSNCILLLTTLYCFQGLSITIFFMNKWKVPVLLRSFFYVMIVFQSLGTLLLLFFGIADIWADFRKLKRDAATISE
jgi:hypothetical protein